MSLFETGHGTGAISLAALLAGTCPKTRDPGLTIAQIAELIAVGGWPGNLGRTAAEAVAAVRSSIDEIRRVDVSRIDGVRRDPARIGRLMRSLARNESKSATLATIAADTGAGDDAVRAYIDVLERLMIVENQPAWAPHLRSRSRLRQGPKRRFVDPSLAVASLRGTPDRLLADIEWFGFLFESLVIRDLRIFAQALDADVFHYLDNTELEVDAIMEPRMGALRQCYPAARTADWRIVEAGIRVQTIKKADRGAVYFGTEVFSSQDKSLVALPGASPGASLAVNIAAEETLGLDLPATMSTV